MNIGKICYCPICLKLFQQYAFLTILSAPQIGAWIFCCLQSPLIQLGICLKSLLKQDQSI